jgi:hypothetical protein
MIKYSKAGEDELELRLQEKFDQLKIRLAEEAGIDVNNMQYNISGGMTPQH